jgi:hypothetical protein
MPQSGSSLKEGPCPFGNHGKGWAIDIHPALAQYLVDLLGGGLDARAGL